MQPFCSNGNIKCVEFGSKVELAKMKTKTCYVRFFDGKGLVWNCILVLKVRPQVAGLQEHATDPGWWECHTQGMLYTTLVSTLTAEAGDRTPDPLNRQEYLLCFSHLATVTGKTSTWESKWYPAVTELGLRASSYMRTQPLFHLWNSLLVLLV